MRAQRRFGRCAQALDGLWLCGWCLRGRAAWAAWALSRTTWTTWATWATLSATTLSGSALSATRATLASGAGRTKLIIGEFSVGVLVEFLQGVSSLSDFNGIDHPVLVGVERFDDWADRTRHALASCCTWTAGAALSSGSGLGGRLRRWRFLGKKRQAGGREAQGD